MLHRKRKCDVISYESSTQQKKPKEDVCLQCVNNQSSHDLWCVIGNFKVPASNAMSAPISHNMTPVTMTTISSSPLSTLPDKPIVNSTAVCLQCKSGQSGHFNHVVLF